MRVATAAVTGGLAALVLGLPSVGAAATQSYLRFDGVGGPASVAGQPGWIEISSYQMGAGNAASSATSGGGSARASLNDIAITKQTDSASPLLFQAATGSRVFSDVDLEVLGLVGAPPTVYHLTNVVIIGFHAGRGAAPETMTLHFTRVEQGQAPPLPNTAHTSSTSPWAN